MYFCTKHYGYTEKYTDDLKTAQALINRDGRVTRQYLYISCYPLFKSIYDNYETDCTCCQEFIDEIYSLILTPGKQSGHCQLENYKGESTLATWLKTTCLFYCYHRYKAKGKLPMMQLPADNDEDDGGRIMDLDLE